MIAGGNVTLYVHDVARAVRFYVETLGLKLVAEPADGSAIFDAGGGFLIALRQGIPAGASPVTLYTKVPLAEAIEIFENRGVPFTKEPTGACFRDLDGNELAIVERPSA